MYMTNIQQRLLDLRKEKGLTQEEVGAKLGVSPQSVSKWENGLTYPDIDLLPEIADLYDVSLDYLLGKDEARNRKDKTPTIHIRVKEQGKDEVNLRLPYPMAKMFMQKGMHLGTEESDKLFSANDLEEAINQGVRGKIIDITEDNGTTVTIEIE